MALWYEKKSDGFPDQNLSLELHFNLWRDLDSGFNFFDVGFLIKTRSESKRRVKHAKVSDLLERFFLFIPGELSRQQFSDLSRLMVHGQTLNAVFNAVVEITTSKEHSFETNIDGKPHLTFYHIDIEKDIEFLSIEKDRQGVGTLVTFRRSLCERFAANGPQYVRVRFRLDRRTFNLFSSETSPSDWFFLSTFSRTEFTEFRLNERRSFPATISVRVSDRSAKYFWLERINYFLMRDGKYELIGAHTAFRKMRQLERDLWQHYLRGAPPGSHLEGGVERALSNAGERIIIYHWRSNVETDSKCRSKSFIAFASFRSPIPNLLVYAFVIVFLGAVGAGLHPIGVEVVRQLASQFGFAPPA